jgi:hypothetical protein
MTDYTAQIAALEEAIAQGAKRVLFRSGGTQREVEYHSIADMIKALEWMRAKQSSKSNVILAAF